MSGNKGSGGVISVVLVAAGIACLIIGGFALFIAMVFGGGGGPLAVAGLLALFLGVVLIGSGISALVRAVIRQRGGRR